MFVSYPEKKRKNDLNHFKEKTGSNMTIRIMSRTSWKFLTFCLVSKLQANSNMNVHVDLFTMFL